MMKIPVDSERNSTVRRICCGICENPFISSVYCFAMRPLLSLVLALSSLTLLTSRAGETVPVWKTNKIEGDPLFFIQKEDGKSMAAFLQTPSEAPVIRSATLEVTYEAGRDYEWTAGSREVKLTKDS